MKTKITLLGLLLSISIYTNAQTVTIPDANFIAWLTTNIPAAMSGNQLDTAHTLVKTLTTMDVENNGIADLTGVQYFTNLRILDCGNGNNAINPNTLTSLPTLPDSLKQLICGNNQITSLPSLPSALDTLKCYKNQLTSLPNLPNSITYFECYTNQLASLPSALPTSLRYFNCGDNQITSLPGLPTPLYWLSCYSNQLTSLPTITDLVYYIDCHNNQLSSLPNLPTVYNSLSSTGGFQYLDCSFNLLTALPTLPTNMTVLKCNSNLLTVLPALPTSSSFYSLSCQDNQLTSLPLLPLALQHLICNNNNITCFPNFPNSLTYIDISANPFTCLPNYVTPMDVTTLAYPLCKAGDNINNPNGCPNAQKGILGYTYKDVDADCAMNTGDSVLTNVHALLYDNTNTLIGQTYTAINGIYDFPDTTGVYTVKIDTVGVPFMAQCAYPGVDSTVTLTLANPIADSVNFNFKCKPGFDIGVIAATTRGLVFPGEEHSLLIGAGDLSRWYNLNCASGVSGELIVTVNGPVAYDTIVSGSLLPTVAGNVFTYTIADFGTLDFITAFGLKFITDTTAQAGDTICVHVAINPTSGDNNMSNNTYDYCYNVINSHDPNLKEVYPVNVPPGYSDWLTYTIHFQNTGNAPAINIRIADTLDTQLDLETFQVTNYSHTKTVSLVNNILTVRFPRIQLPDSTSDLEGSQGFIQYRIKPKANLPLGTQIKNTASIYFDYNPAVVTNTTINEFKTETGTSIKQNKTNSTMSVYPNPGNGNYFIKLSDGMDLSGLTLEVYNLLGEEILKSKVQNSLSVIDISNQPDGFYIVRIVGGTETLNHRIVKNK